MEAADGLNDCPESASLAALFAADGLYRLNDTAETHRDEPKPIGFLLVSTMLREQLSDDAHLGKRGLYLPDAPSS